MIPEMQDSEIIELRRWIEEKWQDRDYFENDQTHYGDAVYRGLKITTNSADSTTRRDWNHA